MRGVFVAAGFNAFGIASGGGAGMALAEWVAKGEPPYDLWPVDIRRFGRNHLDVDWVRTRTLEAYAKHYTMAWPFEEFSSGRPLRRSPLYATLKAQGAVFGEKLGWERPNWFADAAAGETGRGHLLLRTAELVRRRRARASGGARARRALRPDLVRQVPAWSGATRRRRFRGSRANDVAKAPGSLTYTQMLNARGGIECDLTVARLAEDRFYIVTGTGFATHDFDWISRNIPEGLDATLIDITSDNAVFSLFGPRARDVLSALTRDDVSNEGFPFGACRKISVAGAPVLALRVTYVGELGWELHVPVEFAATRLRAADGGRRSRTASPMPATAPSSRSGWRRPTAPGAPTSARTTIR